MKKISLGILLFAGTYFFSACNGSDSNSESTVTQDSTMSSSNMNSTTSTADSSSNTNQSNRDTSSGTTGSATSGTTTAGTAMVDQDARSFVNEAATGGMMEVELGRIASEKGKSQKVKDFGKMMVDDHTKANNDLKALASKKNIDVPAALTDDQTKDVDALSKKSGAEFDKAYVDMMVADHKKDISEFKDASGKLTDNDIKNFATATLPTLQKHLEAIQGIKSKM